MLKIIIDYTNRLHQKKGKSRNSNHENAKRKFIFLLNCFLWVSVFTLYPHTHERERESEREFSINLQFPLHYIQNTYREEEDKQAPLSACFYFFRINAAVASLHTEQGRKRGRMWNGSFY